MKYFLIPGLVFAAYFLKCSVGQEARTNRHAGAGVEMSYSVEFNEDNANSSTPQPTLTSSGGHVAVWRARGNIQGNRRRFNHNGYNSLSNGTHGRIYTARGRRYRARGRRLPDSTVARSRIHHRQNVTTHNRLGRRRHHQHGNRRLIATGSHSIAPGARRHDAGIDPFTALQNGNRRTGPFQDRQTAYDFLSNGGNSFRARNRRMREMRAENARMASVMCGVFGKQFIPSAIGGRCVDPA